MTRIIRNGPGPSDSRHVVAGAVFEAHEAEEARVADANGEAERILVQAQQEAERLRQQAIAEGKERGLAAVTELLVSARQIAQRARETSEQELRVLAVRIAEKLLGRQLDMKPEVVVDVVREALRHTATARDVVIRIHPDDLALVERGKPRLVERVQSARSVTFRPDGAVARGGCIVESELGIVDARLATQLDAIERALRGES